MNTCKLESNFMTSKRFRYLFISYVLKKYVRNILKLNAYNGEAMRYNKFSEFSNLMIREESKTYIKRYKRKRKKVKYEIKLTSYFFFAPIFYNELEIISFSLCLLCCLGNFFCFSLIHIKKKNSCIISQKVTFNFFLWSVKI